MSDNIANRRQDDSVYADMIASIAKIEGEKNKAEANDGQEISMMDRLSESDMRYILYNVWNKQSAMSGAAKLDTLILVRWDKHQKLSPWNCVLLTVEESLIHEKQDDIAQFYSVDFCRTVEQKHFAARQHFHALK